MNAVPCTHDRAIAGLDSAWCPDCKKNLPPAVCLGRVSRSNPDSAPLLAETLPRESFPPAPRPSGVSGEDAHPAPLLAETNAPATPALTGFVELTLLGGTAGGNEDIPDAALRPQPSPKPWRSVRSTRSHGRLYYRFAWGTGHKIEGDVHIKGGSIDSPVAAARAEQVQRWINQGVAPDKIAELIRRW